jgi:hypothetical protein
LEKATIQQLPQTSPLKAQPLFSEQPLLSRRAAQCAALVAAVDGHDCLAHGAALKAPRLAKCFGGLDPVRYFDAAAVGCAWVRTRAALVATPLSFFLIKEADWSTSLLSWRI